MTFASTLSADHWLDPLHHERASVQHTLQVLADALVAPWPLHLQIVRGHVTRGSRAVLEARAPPPPGPSVPLGRTAVEQAHALAAGMHPVPGMGAGVGTACTVHTDLHRTRHCSHRSAEGRRTLRECVSALFDFWVLFTALGTTAPRLHSRNQVAVGCVQRATSVHLAASQPRHMHALLAAIAPKGRLQAFSVPLVNTASLAPHRAPIALVRLL
jgi:hypothetical protein